MLVGMEKIAVVEQRRSAVEVKGGLLWYPKECCFADLHLQGA